MYNINGLLISVLCPITVLPVLLPMLSSEAVSEGVVGFAFTRVPTAVSSRFQEGPRGLDGFSCKSIQSSRFFGPPNFPLKRLSWFGKTKN